MHSITSVVKKWTGTW